MDAVWALFFGRTVEAREARIECCSSRAPHVVVNPWKCGPKVQNFVYNEVFKIGETVRLRGVVTTLCPSSTHVCR